MHRRKELGSTLFVIVCFVILATSIRFSSIEVRAEEKYDYEKLGLTLLDQHHRKTAWGNNWCAPTSAATSLSWFAEGGYPSLLEDYDHDNDKDINDKYELADRLGKFYMNTDPNRGTKIENKVKGIKKYIKDCGYGDRFSVTHYVDKTTPNFATYYSELSSGEDVLVGTPTHVMVGWAGNSVANKDKTHNVGLYDPHTPGKVDTVMKENGEFKYPGEKWTKFFDMVSISPVPEYIIPIGRLDPPTYVLVQEGDTGDTFVIQGEYPSPEVVYLATGSVYGLANGTTLITSGTYYPVGGLPYPFDRDYRQYIEENGVAVDEQFGPEMDTINYKLYSDIDSEFTALENGEIDIADSSLTEDWITRWTGNSEIQMLDYGYGYGTKAARITYSGGTRGVPVTPDDGENAYRGKDWRGFSNEHWIGLNGWASFLGAHVEDGSGRPMHGGVIRYGLSDAEFAMFNPIYSSRYWEWEVLGKAYETLTRPFARDLTEDLEWLAKRWEVGIWTNPITGELAAKLLFELRDDVYWHDGQQLDADDIIFTMRDLLSTVYSRDLPLPWFYSDIMDVYDVVKIDPFKVEVRMYWLDSYAFWDIGGVPILPEHVWRPIVTSGDPTTFAPDPQLIGAGPYKVYPHSILAADNDYYVPYQYVKMDKFTSYFQNSPVRAASHVGASGGAGKLVLTFSDFCPYTIDLEVTATVTGYTSASKTTVNWGPNVYNFAWTGLNPPPGSDGSVPTVVRGLIDLTGVPKGTYLKTQLAMTMKIGGVTVWTKSLTLDPRAYGYTVPGDITNDGAVNVLDAIHLSFHFGLKAYVWPEDDLNLDNAINVQDALVLIANWGASP